VRRNNLYKKIKEELDNIKNKSTEYYHEQLKILEPEYKNIQEQEKKTREGTLLEIRYAYYQSQLERITGGEEYEEKLQKRCREALVLLVSYHVKYHELLGEDNPEYREKYKKYRKCFEDFLLANNEDGKIFEHIRINESDIISIVELTINQADIKQVEVLSQLKELVSISTKPIPKWRQHLIEKTLVFEDGKTVKGKLDIVARAVVEFTHDPITWQFLQLHFCQIGGKKYSKKTCEQARDYANTKC